MIMTTRAQIYISILALFVATASRADDVPKRFNFDRYQMMMVRSPFAVATAVALPAATPNFAKDLYVANAAKSPEGDMVTVASSADKNFKEYLTTKGPNEDGYGIGNIEWSDKVGATKVTISKDGQFATLTFNQALLASSPATGAPGAPPAVVVPPGGPAPPQSYPKPAPIPSLPNPRVRGVIQRNPEVPAPVPHQHDIPES
jgi:hypothetical protein